MNMDTYIAEFYIERALEIVEEEKKQYNQSKGKHTYVEHHPENDDIMNELMDND